MKTLLIVMLALFSAGVLAQERLRWEVTRSAIAGSDPLAHAVQVDLICHHAKEQRYPLDRLNLFSAALGVWLARCIEETLQTAGGQAVEAAAAQWQLDEAGAAYMREQTQTP